MWWLQSQASLEGEHKIDFERGSNEIVSTLRPPVSISISLRSIVYFCGCKKHGCEEIPRGLGSGRRDRRSQWEISSHDPSIPSSRPAGTRSGGLARTITALPHLGSFIPFHVFHWSCIPPTFEWSRTNSPRNVCSRVYREALWRNGARAASPVAGCVLICICHQEDERKRPRDAEQPQRERADGVQQ